GEGAGRCDLREHGPSLYEIADFRGSRPRSAPSPGQVAHRPQGRCAEPGPSAFGLRVPHALLPRAADLRRGRPGTEALRRGRAARRLPFSVEPPRGCRRNGWYAGGLSHRVLSFPSILILKTFGAAGRGGRPAAPAHLD